MISATTPTLETDSALPLSDSSLTEKIFHIEAYARTQPRVVIAERHWFADGMYAREFTVPAGTLMTGAIHFREAISMLTKGRVRVITNEGETDLVAPCTFVQPAGVKRIGLVLEDMVWTTFHTCKATTPEAAQLELVTNSGHIDLIEGVPV
jgi:hypothetical protein